MVNIDHIKAGDTVTARFGKYKISGPVDGYEPLKIMGLYYLSNADEIIEHIPAKPAWLDALVVRDRFGDLWHRKAYTWQGIGHTGSVSPLSALGSRDITVIIDKNGEVA